MSDNDILNAFMGSVADGIAATEAAVNRLAAQNADLLAACKALVGLVEAMGLDAITASGISHLACCQLMKEARAAIKAAENSD